MRNIQHRRSSFRIASGTAAIAVLAMLACGERLVNAYAFFPEKGEQVDPSGMFRPVEHLMLEAADGTKLHAYLLEDEGADRWILFLHGNAGNASHRLSFAAQLSDLGANVLLLDYRGYGLSDGEPSEAGIDMDGEAALRWLTETREVPEGRIVVMGRSLGTSVAVHIAQDRELAGIVLVSPMTSGRDIADNAGLGSLAPSIGHPFDSESKIANVSSPLLVIHGDADDVLPLEMGKTLHDLAPGPKEMVIVPGAGHDDVVTRDPGLFFGAVRDFLDEVAPLDA